MTSKHYRWQSRWSIDTAARRLHHECGLAVTFEGRALNDRQVIEALAVKHGHNAAAMVRRLMREAAELAGKGTHEPNH